MKMTKHLVVHDKEGFNKNMGELPKSLYIYISIACSTTSSSACCCWLISTKGKIDQFETWNTLTNRHKQWLQWFYEWEGETFVPWSHHSIIASICKQAFLPALGSKQLRISSGASLLLATTASRWNCVSPSFCLLSRLCQWSDKISLQP